jgi:hypothetical protein
MPPAVTAAAAAIPPPQAVERPAAVILDEKGRTVDDKGHEIQMHYEPTLKANLRAKKRDELRENLKGAETVDHHDQVGGGATRLNGIKCPQFIYLHFDILMIVFST